MCMRTPPERIEQERTRPCFFYKQGMNIELQKILVHWPHMVLFLRTHTLKSRSFLPPPLLLNAYRCHRQRDHPPQLQLPPPPSLLPTTIRIITTTHHHHHHHRHHHHYHYYFCHHHHHHTNHHHHHRHSHHTNHHQRRHHHCHPVHKR
jgi:hypothetical protein